jgi:hypothetical protein
MLGVLLYFGHPKWNASLAPGAVGITTEWINGQGSRYRGGKDSIPGLMLVQELRFQVVYSYKAT